MCRLAATESEARSHPQFLRCQRHRIPDCTACCLPRSASKRRRDSPTNHLRSKHDTAWKEGQALLSQSKLLISPMSAVHPFPMRLEDLMKRFNWSRSLVILTFRNSSTRGRVLFNSPSRWHPDNTIINLCSLFKWSFGIRIELLCVSVCLIPNEPTYPRESQRRVTAILEAVNFEQQHDYQPPLAWAKTSSEPQTPLTSCKHFHLWTLVMWYCTRKSLGLYINYWKKLANTVWDRISLTTPLVHIQAFHLLEFFQQLFPLTWADWSFWFRFSALRVTNCVVVSVVQMMLQSNSHCTQQCAHFEDLKGPSCGYLLEPCNN